MSLFPLQRSAKEGKKKCPDEGRLCWKFTCARSADYPSSCSAFSIITAKTEKQLHTASQPSVVCSSLWDRYCLGNSPFHTDLVVSYHLLSHSVQTAAFTLVSPSARDSQQQEMQESCNSSIPHSQFSEMPSSGVCWTAKGGFTAPGCGSRTLGFTSDSATHQSPWASLSSTGHKMRNKQN